MLLCCVSASMLLLAVSGDAKLGAGGSRGDIGRVDHHANRHPQASSFKAGEYSTTDKYGTVLYTAMQPLVVV